MRNGVIIQHCYDGKYVPALQLTFARHADYCNKWDLDYQVKIGQVPRYEHDSWAKISMLQEALWWHDYAIWLDADTLIRDMDTDIRRACVAPLALAKWTHPLDHLQAGIIYTREDGLPLIDYMMNERKYFMKRFSGLRGWLEQGQINEMACDPHFSELIRETDQKYNWSELYCPPCPDVVVEAWHGEGLEMFLPKMQQRMTDIKAGRL